MQKVSDLAAALKFLETRDIAEYNIHSVSTSKLGAVVVSALGGKKSKASPEDFLPFDTRKLKKDSGITIDTVKVLQRLMRTQKLDGRLIGLLADELKYASLRNEE